MAAKRTRITARRRVAVVALAASVVVIAAGTIWALTRGGGTTYRTAIAANATVTQTLSSVGTVSSANRASVSFPVSGKVATVPVSLGQHVDAGQTVATLDTTSLKQSVDSASSTLASSKQRLASDVAGQTSSASSTSSQSPSSSPSTSSSLSTNSLVARQLTIGTASSAPSGGPTHGSGSGGGIAGLQQAVLAAQRQLDALLRSINLSACQQSTATTFSVDAVVATGQSGGGPPANNGVAGGGDTVSVTVTVPTGTTATLVDDTGTAVPPASAPLTATLTATGTTFTFAPIATTTYPGPYSVLFSLPATQSLSSSCVAADLQTLQQQVAAAEAQLNTAIANLTKALAALQSTTSHSSTPTQHSTGTTKTAGSGTGTGTGGTGSGTGSGSSTGTVATAADLAADQAHIDAATANLQVAQQDLAAATLTTPIAGTVADVTLSAGADVAAASQTAEITIVGPGTTLVHTTVPISGLDDVKVGERAQVVVDGDADPVAATVSQIGVLDSSSGSTTTYPVTLQLAATGAHFYDGAGADVTITVRSVSDVLSVPTSAVHSLASIHTVDVLTGGKVTTVRVGLGAMGDDRTQITSGLTAGQRVVLADLGTPLPSNNTNLRRLTGGSGLTGTGLTGVTGRTSKAGGG